jgi:hypothetical protein
MPLRGCLTIHQCFQNVGEWWFWRDDDIWEQSPNGAVRPTVHITSSPVCSIPYLQAVRIPQLCSIYGSFPRHILIKKSDLH